MEIAMVKTTVINSPLALKATRGTIQLWAKDNRFGGGTEPQSGRQTWPAHLLQDVAIDFLQQGYSLRIYNHD